MYFSTVWKKRKTSIQTLNWPLDFFASFKNSAIEIIIKHDEEKVLFNLSYDLVVYCTAFTSESTTA